MALLAGLLLAWGIAAAGAQAGAAQADRELRTRQAQDRETEAGEVQPRSPLSSLPPSPSPSSEPLASPFLSSPTSPEAFARRLVAEELVRLTNVERAREGLGPLRTNERLTAAAQAYAEALAPGECFDHVCPPIPLLQDRVARRGYSGWSWIGENIAAGDRTADAVLATWMASRGHRSNILKPEFNEIGVGVAAGSGRDRDYWVQVFGTRHE